MMDIFGDTVTIVNEGKRIESVRAIVDKDKVYVDDIRIPLEEGDTIERKLENGRTEILKVTNVLQRTGGPLSHYEIEIERQGARSMQTQPSTINVNVLDSAQPRININSIDQSTNILNSQPDELFEEIRSLLQGSVSDGEELDRILMRVDDMEDSIGTPDEFKRAYKEFISVAANHLTILAPMLPALSSLLD